MDVAGCAVGDEVARQQPSRWDADAPTRRSVCPRPAGIPITGTAPNLGESASLTDADPAAVSQRLVLELAARVATHAVRLIGYLRSIGNVREFLAGQGYVEASRAALERAVELDPCDLNAYAVLANDAATRGDEPQVERHLLQQPSVVRVWRQSCRRRRAAC